MPPPQFPALESRAFNIIKANLVKIRGSYLKLWHKTARSLCSQLADSLPKRHIHMHHVRYKYKTKGRKSILPICSTSEKVS